MMTDKIGVIVSSYNGSKYIEEQLESIIKQTKLVSKIYLFDDKSTDNTVGIAKKCLQKGNVPYEIIVNSVNKGWKKNFFDALNYVHENYVFLADQDDIWNSTKVEEMIQVMEDNVHINLLTSNYELLFSEDSTTEKNEEERRLVKDGRLMKIDMIPKEFYVRQPGCSYLIRKSFFEEYKNLWNEDMPHDSFLWKTALFSNSLYSLNKPLFKWRRHSSNESNRSKINLYSRIREVNSNYDYMCAVNKVFDIEFVQRALAFCRLRKIMFEKKSVYIWIKLAFRYRNYYVSNRSCIGDLYLLIGLGDK